VSEAAFRDALVAAGIEAEVEAVGKVAIVRAALPLNPGIRRRVVSLGREHGFSNVALELTTTSADPSLHSG
jgi:hypothetical protein